MVTVDRRPPRVSDATVEAVGTTSEASEYLIRSRVALYEFHQLMGHLDLLLGDAADALSAAGHGHEADALRDEVIGRNALDGRWTFQIVEEYDALYFEPVLHHLRALEAHLMDGRRHVHESEMKERRRSHDRPGHEARPPSGWTDAVDTGEQR